MKRVIESDHYSMGPEVAQFEKEFAEFFGSKYAVMVNSGSSANLLAVASLFFCDNPLKAGDEVIVPAVSWGTTYFPLQQYGLKLVFVDVDETLNLDLEKVKNSITSKTKAIVAVNLLGNPVNYDLLKNIAGKDIFIIEDNCESMGAKLGGKYAGTFGTVGTFSTFFSHHISTMEGGVVTTDREDIYHTLLSLRSHGWTRQLPDSGPIHTKSKDAFEESFKFILPGYNVRPLELSGAIGRAQLKKLPEIIEGRRKNGKTFQDLFGNRKTVTIQKETGESSWFGFALIFGSQAERNKAVKELQICKVDTRPIVAGNFTRNPVIKYFDYRVHGDLAWSDIIHDCGLFIGNHHYDISEELYKVQDILMGGKNV
jgi:CDP-6-deoxy-D-xylo-4-hexulose-3-dehydrase